MRRVPSKMRAAISVQSLTSAQTPLSSITTSTDPLTLSRVPWMEGVPITRGVKKTTASVLQSKRCVLNLIPVLKAETVVKHLMMTVKGANSTIFVQITTGKTGTRQ